MKLFLKIIVALVVVLLLIVTFGLGPIIKTAAEKIGPSVAGVPIQVEKVKVSPFTGNVRLKGLIVGNPQGFKTPSLAELGDFKVDLKLASLLSDTIVIKEILIDSPSFTYEKTLKSSNLATLLDTLEQKKPAATEAPAEPEPAEAPEEKPAKPAKKVVIEHFLLKNGQVNLSFGFMGGKAIPLPLPPVEMNDIGKEGKGAELKDVISEIVGQIFESIKSVAGKAGDLSKDALKEGGEALKNVGSGATETLKDVGSGTTEAVKDVGKQAGEAIKSLGGFLKKEE